MKGEKNAVDRSERRERRDCRNPQLSALTPCERPIALQLPQGSLVSRLPFWPQTSTPTSPLLSICGEVHCCLAQPDQLLYQYVPTTLYHTNIHLPLLFQPAFWKTIGLIADLFATVHGSARRLENLLELTVTISL